MTFPVFYSDIFLGDFPLGVLAEVNKVQGLQYCPERNKILLIRLQVLISTHSVKFSQILSKFVGYPLKFFLGVPFLIHNKFFD